MINNRVPRGKLKATVWKLLIRTAAERRVYEIIITIGFIKFQSVFLKSPSVKVDFWSENHPFLFCLMTITHVFYFPIDDHVNWTKLPPRTSDGDGSEDMEKQKILLAEQ